MIDAIVKELCASADVIENCAAMSTQIEAAAKLTIAAFKQGGRLYLAGNGGSAALAQHLAAELVGRYRMNRPALPAFCLTDNQAALTAIANDYDFSEIFRRQLEIMAKPGDVVWLFTTSGRSSNIMKALDSLYLRDVATIVFTGSAGLDEYTTTPDVLLAVPSDVTSRVQDAHGVIGHVLCGLIECAIFGSEEARWLKYR